MRIILYDDDSGQRRQMEEQLRQCAKELLRPIEVVVPNGQRELERLLRGEKADLLVVTQSGHGSREIVKQMTGTEYCCPILWFSELDFAVDSYEYGVTWFGRKPVEQHVLQKAIQRALNSSSSRRWSGAHMVSQ